MNANTWQPSAKDPMRFLGGYPPGVLDQVRDLAAAGKLGEHISRRYPAQHGVQSDRALYDYASELKQEFLRSAPPLHKVGYDARLDTAHKALGLHTAISRVQGGKLKAKHEIRVATMFKEVPLEFLRMIAVHELAHVKEKQHDKAFYKLCCYMEPNYHQYEFDLRLYLTQLELSPGRLW